jgi:hypothetical protein
MAYFAKLGKGNIVERVAVVSNDVATTEQAGVEFLQNLYKDRAVWKQTSYNGNIRKNYAGVGFKYDQTRDAFIPPSPYASWVINETTCLWEAPIPKPNEDTNEIRYEWDEDNRAWQQKNYTYNAETEKWDLNE